MFRFVLINETAGDTSALAGQVTADVLTRAASDIQDWLTSDVAQYWPAAAGATVRVGSGPTDLVADEIAAPITPTLANAPGDEAYHDVDGKACPVVFIGLDTVPTLDELTAAIAHEFAETIENPGCNEFADDGQGHEWAHELCDAVQGGRYRKGTTMVSDFVLPPFYVPGAAGPYNWLGIADPSQGLPAPFATAAGGYQIQRTSGGGETQVTGTVPNLAKARHASSRPYRLGARL
jgi:hypothetical protein